MCVYASALACQVCAGAHRGYQIHAAAVTGGCEMPNVEDGLGLLEEQQLLLPLSRLSSPTNRVSEGIRTSVHGKEKQDSSKGVKENHPALPAHQRLLVKINVELSKFLWSRTDADKNLYLEPSKGRRYFRKWYYWVSDQGHSSI